jgi:hypothetical protein
MKAANLQFGLLIPDSGQTENQPRGTRPEDEDGLTEAIAELARQYGRYGYRRITALLKRMAGSLARTGWSVSIGAKG